MLIDLAAAGDWRPRPHYDVAIAGAGPAGIALALTLAAGGRTALLLEAGAGDVTAEAAAMTQGGNVGHPNVPLDVSRARVLGGASTHWGGWCRTLDPVDFERRPGLPLTGWPIGPAALAPHLETAAAWLAVAPPAPDGDPLPGAGGALRPIHLAFSRPPRNFAAAYGEALAAAPAVDLVLNAAVVDARFNSEAGAIEAFRFRSPGDPRLHEATAARFVLAGGGIENARLLLHLNRRLAQAGGREGALGDAGSWVGRGFMQHLHGSLGAIFRLEAAGAPAPIPDALWGPAGEHRFYAATAQAMLAQESGAVRLYARPERCPFAAGVPSPWDLLAAIGCRLSPVGSLRATGEQLPDRASRVLLSDEPDPLGLPRALLDWRPQAADRRSLQLAAAAFGRFLATLGPFRLQPAEWLAWEGARFPAPDGGHPGDLGAASHHMGTTRMAADARHGVADADARVFGSRNLHLAGSSLFPTGGHANPTLPLLQLALRLADHLLKTA